MPLSGLDLSTYIRSVPDFPVPGVEYKDITPLLHDPQAFRTVVDVLAERYAGQSIDAIVGVEPRGYLFAAPLAYLLQVNLSVVRTAGSLPAETYEVTNYLHFGDEKLQIHRDAIKPGARVVLIEDILATGSTTVGACDLIKMAGGQLIEVAFSIEITALNGRAELADYPIFSLVKY